MPGKQDMVWPAKLDKARVWHCHWLLPAIIALAATSPAWAGISACGTAAPIDPTYTPASTSNGCFIGDLQFSNFAVGTDVGATINGVALPAANVVGSPVTGPEPPDGTVVTVASAPGGFGIELAPIPINMPKTGFCASNSNSGGWCINGANLALASDVTYQVDALNGTTFNFIGLVVTFGLHTNASGAGATAVDFREICPGTTLATINTAIMNGATSFKQACGAAYQVIQVGALNFSGNPNSFPTQEGTASFSPVTVAAIRDTVLLVTPNGGGSWAAIESLDFAAPEPATYGLVGLALAGFGVLRFRRKRGRSPSA